MSVLMFVAPLSRTRSAPIDQAALVEDGAKKDSGTQSRQSLDASHA